VNVRDLHAVLDDPSHAGDLSPSEAARMAADVAAALAALTRRAAEREPEAAAGPMLTATEAAKRCGMSKRWLYAKARKRELPFARLVSARSVRFDARGMERWLARRKS
jgi:excisionase family DNA binding protein